MVSDQSVVEHLRGQPVWVYEGKYRKIKTVLPMKQTTAEGRDFFVDQGGLTHVEAPPESEVSVVEVVPPGTRSQRRHSAAPPVPTKARPQRPRRQQAPPLEVKADVKKGKNAVDPVPERKSEVQVEPPKTEVKVDPPESKTEVQAEPPPPPKPVEQEEPPDWEDSDSRSRSRSRSRSHSHPQK